MKPEPLTKEKIWKTKEFHNINIGQSKKDFDIVLLDDVKSAVEWLLKEIEKEREQIENLKPIYNDCGNYEDWSCPVCRIHFKEETKAYEHVEWEKRELRKGKGKMLGWFEEKIKKWFADVVEE